MFKRSSSIYIFASYLVILFNLPLLDLTKYGSNTITRLSILPFILISE